MSGNVAGRSFMHRVYPGQLRTSAQLRPSGDREASVGCTLAVACGLAGLSFGSWSESQPEWMPDILFCQAFCAEHVERGTF